MLRLPLLSLAALALLTACPSAVPEPEPTPSPEPEPGAFQAGAAVVRMPVPVGIGTAGSSFLGGPDSDSPYANSFPATTRLHGHPDVRAVMYSRGEGFEVVLVRVDMIAAPEQLREAVLVELAERSGRDYDDALVLSATHTHSGPGRFIEGFYSIITDDFLPPHYIRVVDSIADAIEAAYADLAPAELAVVRASAPDGHDDRRCEDGLDYTNDDAPLLTVRKDGVIESVVMSYAIHGTVLGIDDLTLSKDVSGAIEDFTEAELGEPGAMVMLMNSWGADASPATPDVAPPASATPLPDGYDKLERVGSYMAGVVSSSLAGASFSDTPDIDGATYRYPINHSLLDYQLGEFPFLYGGVYCQGAVDCEAPGPPQPLEDIDEACLPFPEDNPAPLQSMVTVGRIGGSHFMTWGGECGTKLAERTMDEMLALDGVSDVVFFGYANDYMGYALEYDDWYFGGYEASGSMWGPKQGEYMSARAVDAMNHYVVGGELAFTQADNVALFDVSDPVAVPTETGLDVATMVTQPTDSGPGGVVTATVYGSDPWFGAPVAVLQTESGGWSDVTFGDGSAFDSDGYGFWVDMVPDPPYSDDDVLPLTRHFAWSFTLAVSSRLSERAGVGAGTYRFRIAVPQDGAEPVEVTTDSFALTP